MQYKRGGGRGFENNIGFRNEVLVSKSPTESIQNFKKVLHYITNYIHQLQIGKMKWGSSTTVTGWSVKTSYLTGA